MPFPCTERSWVIVWQQLDLWTSTFVPQYCHLQVPCHLFEGSSYFIRGLQTRDWIWCLLLQELLRVGNLVRNRICGNWFILPAFIGEMTWWIDNYRSIKRHLVVKCGSPVNDYTDTVSTNYELLCLLMWSWYTLLFFYTQRDLTE